MSAHTLLRRVGVVAAGVVTALAVTAGSASAHHCYVPMWNLNGPTSSSWFVATAELGAADIAGYTAACAGAVDAGYAALEEAGLPVAIKIKETKTIGDPKDTGRMNPNGANGKGLEYFGAGSTLAFEMVETWIAGAESHDCG